MRKPNNLEVIILTEALTLLLMCVVSFYIHTVKRPAPTIHEESGSYKGIRYFRGHADCPLGWYAIMAKGDSQWSTASIEGYRAIMSRVTCLRETELGDYTEAPHQVVLEMQGQGVTP